MRRSNVAPIAIAGALCGIGGWIGEPMWAGAIGLAIGGVVMALGSVSELALRNQDRASDER